MAKPINRTDKLTGGREIPNSGGKVALYESAPGGLRKKRCPKCRTGIASPVRLADGKEAYSCGSCGAVLKSMSM